MDVLFLRQELENKTKLLEKTSEALLDSQKQYQKLLKLYEEEKNKNKILNDEKNSINNSINSYYSNTGSSFDNESRLYKKPLYQNEDFESTIQKLSRQMASEICRGGDY